MPVILSTDLIVCFLVATIIYFAVASRKEGTLKTVWREIRRNRLAMLSMVFLAAYVGLALMDSIRWRDAVTDGSGQSTVTQAGEDVYSPEALSLLDRAFSVSRLNTEKTYS